MGFAQWYRQKRQAVELSRLPESEPVSVVARESGYLPGSFDNMC
ncbi:hypothetical protein [Paraburkholderia adhaesiva]|nr:hypothetical protein [Paraburkholderia adhaesiva]